MLRPYNDSLGCNKVNYSTMTVVLFSYIITGQE